MGSSRTLLRGPRGPVQVCSFRVDVLTLAQAVLARTVASVGLRGWTRKVPGGGEPFKFRA